MSKLYPILTDVTGVPGASASSKVTLKIPAGDDPGAGRLMNIRALVTRGGVAATVAQIRAALRQYSFNLGTETVQREHVSELLVKQTVQGYTVESGIVDFYFAEPWRATVTDEEVLAPDLRRNSKVSLEIDVTNDATPLVFEFNAEYSLAPKVDTQGRPVVGMIGKTVQIEDISGGEPVFKVDPLNGPLQRLYLLYPDAAVVSEVTVMQGETVLYQRREGAGVKGLTAQLKGMGMVVPAAFTDSNGTWKTWPIIFDNNQQLRNALMDPNGLRLKVKIDTAAGIRLLRETQIARG